MLLKGISIDVQLYKSRDTDLDPFEAFQNSIEFLSYLELLGVYPYRLQLKLVTPITLLRNLDLRKLCKETCMVVKKLFSTWHYQLP